MKSKGFLLKSLDDEENSENLREEEYRRLFPKIGRDFLTREEFEKTLYDLLSALDLLKEIEIENMHLAILKAAEYKTSLEEFSFGSYKDLINLDD